MLTLRKLPAAVAFLFLACTGFIAKGAETEPGRLLPESSIAYLGVTRPQVLIDAVANSELYDKLAEIEQVKRYLASENFNRLKMLTVVLETRLGLSWQELLRDVLGGGVHVAYDPQTKASLVVVRASKPETLKKLHETLVELIEADARNKGKDSPIKSKDHLGVKGWSFDQGEAHAIVGDLLLFSDRPDGLKGMIERSTESSAQGLAGNKNYQQAKELNFPMIATRATGPAPFAWTLVDLDAARMAPNTKKILAGPSNNPLLELLAGGVLDAAGKAPFVTARASWSNGDLRVLTSLPRDGEKLAESRRWCFSPETGKGAPAPLVPPGSIGTFTLYRDLSGMWMNRESLFDEKINSGFTQADAQLGLYFSGRDFGPEVLGELSPRWQIVVARREFPSTEPVPAIKLPEFALVLELKDQDFAKQLSLAYQNIVGIINLTGLQSGRPQLLITTEEHQGVKITKAMHVVANTADKEKARLEYNFRPSCAQVGSHFVIGSTVGVVRNLVDLLQGARSGETTMDNSLLKLSGEQLYQALADNRELFVSRRMLSQGTSRDEADRSIGKLLDLAKSIQEADLQLVDSAKSLTLGLHVRVRE
jgi:hypothetical protein